MWEPSRIPETLIMDAQTKYRLLFSLTYQRLLSLI